MSAGRDESAAPGAPVGAESAQPGGRRTVWGGHLAGESDALMLEFCSGRDVSALPQADAELLPYDLWTNRAHAIMLAEEGLIPADTCAGLLAALNALEAAWGEGRFVLDAALEDVHINVEHWVSAQAGAEAGGRLHTARSRNDQAACDLRLLMRARLLGLAAAVESLAASLLAGALAHAGLPMPGFTHHQPAMPTSWGHWLCAPAQGLLRDLERIRSCVELLNRSPLGAGASYGVSWPINRARTAELLGFAAVDENTLDCISARGEHEASCAFVHALLMRRLAALAQDFLLFSHPYWGFLALPEAFVTGSSIMPQKRNPDFAEVLKGKSAWVQGAVMSLLGIAQGAMHGYHRDSQWSKYPLLDVLRECQGAAPLLQRVVQGVIPQPAAMRARLDQGFLQATDFADALAREFALPFRRGYHIAAEAVGLSAGHGHITPQAAAEALRKAGLPPQRAQPLLQALQDPGGLLARRQHSGSPAPAEVRSTAARLQQALAQAQEWRTALQNHLQQAWQACRDYELN